MDFDASTPTYAHDVNGNLTSDGVFAYAYDAVNQLTNVVRTADGARVLSARYDALGRRVEATRADGSVERYVYFPGSFLVLAVLDGANAVKEVYTRGPDLSGSLDGAGGIGGILAVTDASSVVRYYHADIMGNVIALTDASGSVAATFRYTPFGQLSARTGSVLPRYLFSSKEFDRTANLYYYGYRYYAPRMGRWMTRDPIGEASGANRYASIGNAPALCVDAFGLYILSDCQTDVYNSSFELGAIAWLGLGLNTTVKKCKCQCAPTCPMGEYIEVSANVYETIGIAIGARVKVFGVGIDALIEGPHVTWNLLNVTYIYDECSNQREPYWVFSDSLELAPGITGVSLQLWPISVSGKTDVHFVLEQRLKVGRYLTSYDADIRIDYNIGLEFVLMFRQFQWGLFGSETLVASEQILY